MICAAMLPGCHYSAGHSHHRRLRSQGGHGGPTVDLCASCHALVHANPAWSARHGLILRAGDDPSVLVTSCQLSCTADHREEVA